MPWIQAELRPYRAPELLFNDAQHNPFAIDLWALGATLSEFMLETGASSEHSEIFEDGSTTLRSRRTLFDDTFGEIGLAGSIFRLRGSPNADTWPEFQSLPDSSKVIFDPQQPQPLQNILSLWSMIVQGQEFVDIINGLLALSPSRRLRANDALSSLQKLSDIHLPTSYTCAEDRNLIRDTCLVDILRAPMSRTTSCIQIPSQDQIR